MKQLRYILLPFSGLYWLFTYVRNVCFDRHILQQTEFSLPLISVGNITVGGTGKTPHVQYLVNLLRNKNVATLSRGYKRKSKGFVLASAETNVSMLGDEPFLLQQRFPDLHVAVCEKRVEGVLRLLENVSVWMHCIWMMHTTRYVKPGLQLLLGRLQSAVVERLGIPAGMLREGNVCRSRAHIVVVSKCPQIMGESETNPGRQNAFAQQSAVVFLYHAVRCDLSIQHKTCG